MAINSFVIMYLNQLKAFDRLNNLKQFEPVWFYRNVNIFSLFRRLAENSKLQSNVKYHAEFEAAKGKFTQIADDPETQRIKANSQVIRLVFWAFEQKSMSLSYICALGKVINVQGVPSGRGLGWVELNFECSTVCPIMPGLMGTWQKRLGSRIRWRNNQTKFNQYN